MCDPLCWVSKEVILVIQFHHGFVPGIQLAVAHVVCVDEAPLASTKYKTDSFLLSIVAWYSCWYTCIQMTRLPGIQLTVAHVVSVDKAQLTPAKHNVDILIVDLCCMKVVNIHVYK